MRKSSNKKAVEMSDVSLNNVSGGGESFYFKYLPYSLNGVSRGYYVVKRGKSEDTKVGYADTIEGAKKVALSLGLDENDCIEDPKDRNVDLGGYKPSFKRPTLGL